MSEEASSENVGRAERIKNGCLGKKKHRARLEVFFNVKTHKEGYRFRMIVSEKGSWQHRAGLFLQQCLSLLLVDGAYQMRRTQDVSEFFMNHCPLGGVCFRLA